MVSDTRIRMIGATVAALQRHGVAGMSFTEILNDSGAARGAIYHHFPGGKAQLVAEAAARHGEDVQARLAQLPVDSPQSVVEAFLNLVRPVVRASAEGGGCAVAAVTVTDADDLRQIAANAFASWIATLIDRLTVAGVARDKAAALATTLIVLLEGAHVLCRAAGNLDPFDQAARTASALIDRHQT